MCEYVDKVSWIRTHGQNFQSCKRFCRRGLVYKILRMNFRLSFNILWMRFCGQGFMKTKNEFETETNILTNNNMHHIRRERKQAKIYTKPNLCYRHLVQDK